jgi:hypothetical protein
MSWDPNAGQTPSPYTPQPAFRDPYAPRPSSGGSLLFWILGGGALLMVMVCCGGVVGLLAFTKSYMQTEVKEQLRDNPKLREQIGELETVELDFNGTMAEDDDNTFRYNVKGTKATAELTVIESPDDETIVEAHLRLKDGTKVQILP